MFAIFFLKNGQWVQHGNAAASASALSVELDYLVNGLGVTAKIFRKL